MSTRVLFLDDSGKPAANDSSRAVVIGGFSVASSSVPRLSRQIAGAKGRFFQSRGDPGLWELKAARTITPNPWKRRKNRDFVAEVLRILSRLGCTVYTVSIDKTQMNHPMDLRTTMPLQLQALVEHFAAECTYVDATGLIVSDWSNHRLDAHASRCVASFVASRRLSLHPTVYYANSLTSQLIQVAAIRRRIVEGDTRLRTLGQGLAAIHGPAGAATISTHTGRVYSNEIALF